MERNLGAEALIMASALAAAVAEILPDEILRDTFRSLNASHDRAEPDSPTQHATEALGSIIAAALAKRHLLPPEPH